MTTSAYGELAPVMEAYGAGCYAAQSLESSLRLLLVLSRLARTGEQISAEAFEHVESETSWISLMQLFKKAKKKAYFSNHDYRTVKSAIVARNLLIHKYWRRNVTKTLTPEGRALAVDDIDQLKRQIIAADQLILALVDRYLKEYGISTEALQQKAEEMYDAGSESHSDPGRLPDELDDD